MRVSINGEIKEFVEESLTLSELLEIEGYGDGIAVALNETFVLRAKYIDTTIKDGDRLDILSPVQGG